MSRGVNKLMGEAQRLVLRDNDSGGLMGLLPTIADILGWILAFFVIWSVYTIATTIFSGSESSSIDAHETVSPTPSKPAAASTSSISLNAARKVLHTTIADVTDTVEDFIQQESEDSAPQRNNSRDGRAVSRF